MNLKKKLIYLYSKYRQLSILMGWTSINYDANEEPQFKVHCKCIQIKQWQRRIDKLPFKNYCLPYERTTNYGLLVMLIQNSIASIRRLQNVVSESRVASKFHDFKSSGFIYGGIKFH